jgi:hypothetical protein
MELITHGLGAVEWAGLKKCTTWVLPCVIQLATTTKTLGTFLLDRVAVLYGDVRDGGWPLASALLGAAAEVDRWFNVYVYSGGAAQRRRVRNCEEVAICTILVPILRGGASWQSGLRYWEDEARGRPSLYMRPCSGLILLSGR